VTEQPHPAPHGAGIASQIAPQDLGRSVDDGHESRTGAQERSLASAVWTAEEDDLTLGDVEVEPGERWEPSEQRNGGTEVDNQLHEDNRG